MTKISDQVWVVKTPNSVGAVYYYAAVDTIEAAIAGVRGIHGVDPEIIMGANLVKNVDSVPNGEIRLVPEGDYTGPLIP